MKYNISDKYISHKEVLQMKKLLICCLAILLAGVPVCSVSAAAPNTQSIEFNDGDLLLITTEGITDKLSVVNENYSFSLDASSMNTTITMEYPGEVVPNRSVTITRIINGNTYVGTVYLDSYWYHDGVTTAVYEGTLYLQSSTSTS